MLKYYRVKSCIDGKWKKRIITQTQEAMLTTLPQCKYRLEFLEILSQNLFYAIIDWVCLGIPKYCIVGYF